MLWHPVASPKIAYALHKLPPELLNETLVQHLHRKVRKDLEKLNKVDIFMYIKFLESKAVQKVTDDIVMIWQSVLH